MAPTHPDTVRAAARYPVQRDLDGDFTAREILATLGRPDRPTVPQPQPGLAAAAPQPGLGRPARGDAAAPAAVLAAATQPAPPDDGVHGDDLAVLHAFEVSPLCRPPVACAVHALPPALAQAWLALARHW